MENGWIRLLVRLWKKRSMNPSPALPHGRRIDCLSRAAYRLAHARANYASYPPIRRSPHFTMSIRCAVLSAFCALALLLPVGTSAQPTDTDVARAAFPMVGWWGPPP